ncbi:MAG: hypothetical protein J6X33_00800 [Clostridiales bacterium]|nr:hypothetical protein [Clostridiales bacterium]
MADMKMPDIDINKIKEGASDALEQVSKNEQANAVYEKVADTIEDKTKVDVPTAGDLSKMLGN